jgi:hypothetical protein
MSGGLGSANPGAIPTGLPLGSSVWAAGFWFDLVSVPGLDGAVISSPISSLAGSQILTPQSSPLISDTAIGGRKGCSVTDTGVSGTEQLFRCDALANKFFAGLPWTIGLDFRQSAQAQQPLWQARSSTGGVLDYIGGFAIGERMCLQYRSTLTGIQTITGVIPTTYDYHRLIWRYDGTTLFMYVDGVLDSSVALATPTISVNRLAWLGSQSSTSFQGASGFARRWFMTPSDIGSSGVATVDAYLAGQDYTLPGSNILVPKLLTAGASIETGATDAVNGAGWRAGLSQYIIDNTLSWQAIGTHPQGFVPFRESQASSGQSATQITTQVTSIVDSRVSIIQVDLGNQEINLGQTAAQVVTAITTALSAMRTAYYAVNPNGYMVVNLLPAYFEAGFNAVVVTLNAALPAVWDASDAVFPSSPKLLRWDANTAMGGPTYVQANYAGVGNDHPNHLGYTLCIPALLAASNSDGDILSSVLSSLSPT